MKVPRVGIEWELQLEPTPQLTAIPNPQLTERGQGSHRYHVLMDTTWVTNR